VLQRRPSSWAACALGLGDEAIEHLNRAEEGRDPLLVMLARAWPWLEPLRSDPRFVDIVRRLGLSGPGATASR